MNYFIRPATPDDINKIIEFTTQEAQESEGSVVDLVAVERGVSSAFSENPRSKYWVMEDSSGTVIANTSVVKEWSDFHGNDYWWIQSFYIAPEHRGMGLADESSNILQKKLNQKRHWSFAYMSTEITGVRFVLMSDVVSPNLRIPL